MSPISGAQLLSAIESGAFNVEIIPTSSPANPLATDLYELVMKVADQEFARVGVWKSSEGGVVGDGAPRISSDGTAVHVTAGDGMNGSFDVDCAYSTEAEEIANVLEDRLEAEYEGIEVEIGNS
jgi:hypothetical protein